MDARGKFGEHEKCVRVARGAAENSSNLLMMQSFYLYQPTYMLILSRQNCCFVKKKSTPFQGIVLSRREFVLQQQIFVHAVCGIYSKPLFVFFWTLV